MTDNWKKKFSPSALEAGRTWFLKDRVTDLKEENGSYTAAVLETRRYEVKIFLKNGEFTKGKCRCPMANGGGCCGHMAAVLYSLNPEQAGKPKNESKSKTKAVLETEHESKTKPVPAAEPEAKTVEQQIGGGSEEERSRRQEARKKRKEEKKKREAERRRRAAEARDKENSRVQQEQERHRREREKAEEEKKRKEEKRRLEEEARRIADEKRRKEEAERIAAEQKEQLRIRMAEQKRNLEDYELLGEPWEDEDDGEDAGYEQMAALAQYNYFDGKSILDSLNIPGETIEEGNRLLDDEQIKNITVSSGYDRSTGGVCGQADAVGYSKGRSFNMFVIFSHSKVLRSECRCAQCLQDHNRWYTGKSKCAYTAGLLTAVGRYLEHHQISDATDLAGQRLLNSFGRKRFNRLSAEEQGNEQQLQIEPRLLKKDGDLELSFRVGYDKLYVIKNLADFCTKIQNGETDTYGKNTEISLRISALTEQGKQWFHFIKSVVQEERQHDHRMIDRGYYKAARSTPVKGSLELFGWRLDRLYQMLLTDGGINYEDRNSKEKSVLKAGRGNPRVTMQIRPLVIKDSSDFHGIRVEGHLPLIYYGTAAGYYIEDGILKQTDEEFMERTASLAGISDNGEFSFSVGRNHMAEFYYRILPGLGDIVSITEEDTDRIRKYLPPEVRFAFYLDAEDGDISCRIFSKYPGTECSCMDLLFNDVLIESFRDTGREQEVVMKVLQWFPVVDPEKDCLCCDGDEEAIFRVMSEGVDSLLKIGEVRCTKAFRNRHVIKKVNVSVGVSVSQGLLDLDVSASGIPPEELLKVLSGYRQKKKYYRLKDGSFVSLEEDSLKMLLELSEAMRLKDKDFIKGKMHLPLYRTLYLDRMLEEHEEVSAERNSRFREMVKGFKTIADSDFEVPKSLSKIMRNYQKTGYQWLRTLETWNFGGILADDMGLGKTLQVISVLLAAKEEGQNGTSLVIAPASLVFNWGEELGRFAPQLNAVLVTGTQEERQKLIDDWKSSDVLVTSYDLLRRDIALYEGKSFLYQVIDEAQYIKNHTTASAKAVKVITSRTRYALTGTPIENRLSELWSIFDYLMPGFLYGYEVFRKEMETPIVKYQDTEAAERLRKMTSPFILRRMKENVLKDLPEKLEEVRYVRFEEKQQELYDAQVVKLKQNIEQGTGEEFEKNRFRILAEITRLRQICCDPSLCYENYRGKAAKPEACVDLVKSAVEGGHRILLFSQFTSMLEILEKEFQTAGIEYYKITGDTPKKDRLSMVKEFNEGDTPLFLISLKAGGVGLNLTGADIVIHYDPWWNLAVQNQATDRAYRIGQTKKVTVYKLIVKNTIEEKIARIQEAKKDLAGQILGGETGQLAGLSREELLELLEIKN